ncbi:hypothetical protein TNCV_1873681 [Trichonephila clavipes]|nr:hypothetical protein TNCV_1873681 [Trichonephila clavipes]
MNAHETFGVCGQRPPTSLRLKPTSREDLRLNGYLEYSHAEKALYICKHPCFLRNWNPGPTAPTTIQDKKKKKNKYPEITEHVTAEDGKKLGSSRFNSVKRENGVAKSLFCRNHEFAAQARKATLSLSIFFSEPARHLWQDAKWRKSTDTGAVCERSGEARTKNHLWLVAVSSESSDVVYRGGLCHDCDQGPTKSKRPLPVYWTLYSSHPRGNRN